ncbi:SDR family NAD(P)-dependent oxidoreductase [Pseudarthrobacter sp. NPDC058196]|uniref:SDR family NAD(P)-dependent oxidoreductase n=1 Tax=Pseudarthrobacter sp. NPDC058196 TaxID=3346376 RepID=UPI0036D93AD4
MSDGLLTGKSVIITGAGQGLGEAYARAAAVEGANVAVVDLDGVKARAVAESIGENGGSAIAIEADISSWDSTDSVVRATVDAFGKLDGLINNAAFYGPAKAGEETEAEIRRSFEVNVFGAHFLSIHALRAMGEEGSIINVVSGAQSGLVYTSSYGASKGAIASLTYCWAADMQASGNKIRVNAISPYAKTVMLDRTVEFYAERAGGPGSGPLEKADFLDTAPDPSTVAPIAVFLLSDLSTDINGQIVRMEDGDKLSLVTKPHVLAQPLYRPGGWTPRDVAAAFDADLRGRLQPVGIHYLDAKVVPAPDVLEPFVLPSA